MLARSFCARAAPCKKILKTARFLVEPRARVGELVDDHPAAVGFHKAHAAAAAHRHAACDVAKIPLGLRFFAAADFRLL